MDLKDAILNLQLTNAGRPVQAVTSADVGVPPPAPGADPYAPPASSLVQLSGYGQALSAVSQFSNGLQVTPAVASASVSSAPAVATTTASSSAANGTYSVNIAQLAKEQISASAYFGDPNAAYFTPGSFVLQSGGSSTSVSVSTGSLNGVAAAINSANAGVTAAVQSDTFGYRLTLTGQQTGAANTFSASASPSDPFGWSKSLGLLALSQTQASADSSYTINGVAGSSGSNQNVAVDVGVTMNTLAVGSTTITVAPDYNSVLANTNSIISQYNVLRGNLNLLTAAGGQLNGDASANQLSLDAYNATQSTFANPGSALTTLGSIGLTAATQSSPISLNAATLQTAFNSDPLGASALLEQIRTSFNTLAQTYGGSAGTLQTQANTVMNGILNGIQTTLAGAPNLFQSAGLAIYQNQMLYNSMQPQYAGISVFV
ncbi:MAG: flagellar filament capping protein FliD [Sulfuricellaceae bacterium]